MSNEFRKPGLKEPEEEIEEQEEKVEQEPEGSATAFIRKFFTDGVVSKEDATKMLPFLVFLSVIVMVYIANSHMAITNMRKIDQLNREVTELSWEFKSLKAELMFKSKQTEVAKKVDTLGIKALIEPPKKLIVNR